MLGRACPYAHGEKELGTVELVVCGRVKTRICKFWTTGNCAWDDGDVEGGEDEGWECGGQGAGRRQLEWIGSPEGQSSPEGQA